jgi:hypothetical protein
VRRTALTALAATVVAAAATPADAALHARHRHHTRHEEGVRVVRTPPASRPAPRTPKPPTPRPPRVGAPSPPPKPKPLARVQVIAREFTLTLSRRTFAAGVVAIELDNFGQDPHDLRVERADSPATGFSFELARPRTVSSRKLELSAGEWKLYCTLPGHEELGMSARVTVTG